MNSLPTINSTTDNLWWVDDAWGDRMDDVIRVGTQKVSTHEGDVNSFLSEVFTFSRVNRFKQKGFTSGVAPTSEYLTRMYEKYGTPEEINGLGYLRGSIIETPAGMSAFETWKWFFERSEGNREPNRPRPEEPEYGGYTFKARALTLSQRGKFTADEAEYVAGAIANSHVRAITSFSQEHAREYMVSSLEIKDSYIQTEWNLFLSNPILPLLPAPNNTDQTLWDFITSTMLSLVEEDPEEAIFQSRLAWIAQNENASPALLARASSLLEGKARSFGALASIKQHPAVPKTTQEFIELLQFVPEIELESLNDEDFAVAANRILKGDAADPIYRVALELFYDPKREQFAKELIRRLLKEEDWNSLHIFVPLIPAVLNSVEEEIMDATGQIPTEWLMELL